jgi:hypothetical protein
LEVTFSWRCSSDLEAVSIYIMSVGEIAWKGTMWEVEKKMRG